MAGVQSDITRINGAKTDIANAIVAKGGTVDSSAPIESYANAVSSIPLGASSITIGTKVYNEVNGNITAPTIDMVVTFEDDTTATYKVVANA